MSEQTLKSITIADHLSVIDVKDSLLKSIALLANKLSFLATLSSAELVASVHSENLTTISTFSTWKKPEQILGTLLAEYFGPDLSVLGNEFKSQLLQNLAWVLPLCHRTAMLLSFGGDDRLTLDMNKLKLNKYFSSTIPRPDGLRRGSCTCSTITEESYKYAERIRQGMLSEVLSGATTLGLALEAANAGIRASLRRVLSLDGAGSDHDIVLFPSGSDAV